MVNVPINIRGTIFHKSVQILAYADDIDIIGRTQSAMIETFTSLEKEAKGMNLFINQENTKYMPVTKKSHASYPHYLEVRPYKFQAVHSFTYTVRQLYNETDFILTKIAVLSMKQCMPFM